MKKHNISVVLSYVYPVFLGALLALDYTLFIVPNNFAPSGINGIAVMIQYKLDFNIAYMSLLINVPLCIFAFFKIEKEFAVKTLTFSVAYSLAYILFDKISFIQYFKYITDGHDTIYPALIAGLIMGFCIGFSVKNNSSTGGTDIVAKYVSVIRPNLNFFYVTFILNAVVALASLFVYGINENGFAINYKPVCLCVIYAFVSSVVGNRIISGLKHACKFTIVTDQCDELEYEITHTLKHSATRLHGIGIYQHHDKEVLICIVNPHQVADFERIIKKYPNTFVYVESIDQTIGNFIKVK